MGEYIRQHVVPARMTVTEAAKRLGVSRVALSNLLNGRSALTRQMALRLKKAFGADPDALLHIRTKSERAGRRSEERALAVSAYVPSFLRIKTPQIHAWADQHEEARNRLPVLARKLIRSTGRELQRVDFPAYGEVQRKGWDGLVEAEAATPWIPSGRSGWEVSTAQDPTKKADAVFKSRVAEPDDLRAETTFVFVSSRRWLRKGEWEEGRRAAGRWKDVRALDASDLEQWLEESIEGQVWLGEQLGLPSLEDCETLDRAWLRWAKASDPPMTKAMFGPAVAANREKFASWLAGPVPERPFVIAADSKDEALAFLACLSWKSKVPADFQDRAVVIRSARTLRTLAPSTSSFIPIVCGEEAERELVRRQTHSIAVRPRNTVDREPDIALGLLGHRTFEKSLTAMGFGRHGIDRLARESGRSPTILRRCLTENEAIKRPRWAACSVVARKLVPMALVGAWDADSMADREVLRCLAARPASQLEVDVAELLMLDDSPVWATATHRGVASKIDALFAVRPYMTAEDIGNFLDIAEYVLTEPDPALELPRNKRWAAELYDKVRNHSDALRTGTCETLVLLAVHGNDRFQRRLGLDLEDRVSGLVRRLLLPDGAKAPLKAKTLESYNRDLPMLAEAAPDVFLELLESDLDRPEGAVRELLRPAAGGVFGACPRTGLLWALECLAWNPSRLARVALVLAELSRTPIEDNWGNKPIRSLEAIFRSWMPQTAASLERRFQTLEMLCRKVPAVGWQVCREQLRDGPGIGMNSYRPRWRGDAADAGEPVATEETQKFRERTLGLALKWPRPHRDADMLGDLTDLLGLMSREWRCRVWALIDDWLEGSPSESQRAALRERIRRLSVRSTAGVEPALRERARAMYARLSPRDPASRHAWLFAEHWLRDWPEDLDDAMDFSEREQRIGEHRNEAMKEIWSSGGLTGALSLLPSTNAPDTVGCFASQCVSRQRARENVVRACLSGGDLPADSVVDEARMDGFLHGFIRALDEESREELLSSAVEKLTQDESTRLLRCAPCSQPTWRIVDRLGHDVQKKYWRKVNPHPGTRVSTDEISELADRLLDVGRPRAAFKALHLAWAGVETSRLRRLVSGLVTGPEPDRSIPIDGYDVARAIESLSGRIGSSRDEMADLEFVFFETLRRSRYGVPNLERRIAEDPSYFVWLVALVYKRKADGKDPEGWPLANPDDKAAFGQLAFSVLGETAPTPGAESDGSEVDVEKLRAWVYEAREQGAERGRAEAVDTCIGELLSKYSSENSRQWPRRAVCEVMEAVATRKLAQGFVIGVINGRGAHMRCDGGGQERELATKYRALAEPFATEFPFVSRVLESIAKSYDQEATVWDSETELRERLED